MVINLMMREFGFNILIQVSCQWPTLGQTPMDLNSLLPTSQQPGWTTSTQSSVESFMAWTFAGKSRRLKQVNKISLPLKLRSPIVENLLEKTNSSLSNATIFPFILLQDQKMKKKKRQMNIITIELIYRHKLVVNSLLMR
jgi:hypothetical protein